MRRRRGLHSYTVLMAALAALSMTTGAAAQVVSPSPAKLPQELRSLFDYDASAPLAAVQKLVREEAGVRLYDLSFDSPKGGRVTAYQVVPAGTGPFAGVVFGHWGGGVRSEFLSEAMLLAEAGAASVLIDYPWVRPLEWRRPVNDFVRPEADRDTYVQAVVDLRRAIDVLLGVPGVDPARIGYIGHSYGAQWGAILAAVDRRIKAAVLVAGIPALADIFNGDDPDIVQLRAQLPPGTLERYLEVTGVLDAVRYVPFAAPTPLLFQFARFETSFGEPSMNRYAAAASAPKEVRWYDTGHELNDVQALVDRAAWLHTTIGTAAPAPILERRLQAAGAGRAAAAAAPVTDTFEIDSAVLKEKRTILVSAPRGVTTANRRVPVIYLLDGDAHIAQARATVDYLVDNGFMPDVVIVGIPNTDRMRDFTPTHAEYLEFGTQRYPAATSGGAAAFLSFIESELVPRVEAAYPVLPFRVILGHSLGCTFATYALTARPGLFRGTILAAPTLTWDGSAVLRSLAAFLKARPDLRSTLVVAVPGTDARPARTASEELVAMVEAARLPGLRLRRLTLTGDDHDSAPLPALYEGLKTVFEGWKMPADPESGEVRATLAELRRHYDRLSARLGFVVPPPEGLVNGIGYEALGRGDRRGAIELFRFNVATYPESANTHDSLGEALERTGAMQEALECYRRALALAEGAGHPLTAVFRSHLEALEKRSGAAPAAAKSFEQNGSNPDSRRSRSVS